MNIKERQEKTMGGKEKEETNFWDAGVLAGRYDCKIFCRLMLSI